MTAVVVYSGSTAQIGLERSQSEYSTRVLTETDQSTSTIQDLFEVTLPELRRELTEMIRKNSTRSEDTFFDILNASIRAETRSIRGQVTCCLKTINLRWVKYTISQMIEVNFRVRCW